MGPAGGGSIEAHEGVTETPGREIWGLVGAQAEAITEKVCGQAGEFT